MTGSELEFNHYMDLYPIRIKVTVKMIMTNVDYDMNGRKCESEDDEN